jgi:hypothetical protein
MVLVANDLHSQLEPSSIVTDMDAPLSPRDLALLVVLGTAGRARAPLEDIVAAAKTLATRDWQPTGETICGAVETLTRPASLPGPLAGPAASSRAHAHGLRACLARRHDTAPPPAGGVGMSPIPTARGAP